MIRATYSRHNGLMGNDWIMVGGQQLWQTIPEFFVASRAKEILLSGFNTLVPRVEFRNYQAGPGKMVAKCDGTEEFTVQRGARSADCQTSNNG